MRVGNTNAARPERLAKSLRRVLADQGHDVGLGKVREAFAVMSGYRGWNDLLANVGRVTPTPDDQSVGKDEVATRLSLFATRLSGALGIGMDAATRAVEVLGPTSRRGSQTADATGFDVHAAILRIARGLAWAEGAKGGLVDPAHPSAPLFVGQDGAVSGGRGYDLGAMLERAGLSGGRDDGPAPDPRVLAEVRRLDPHALTLLRAATDWGTDAYDMARAMPREHPASVLVRRLPMLGSTIRNAAHHMDNARRTGWAPDWTVDFLTSADPMRTYVDGVVGETAGLWPHAPIDEGSVESVVEAVGGLCCHHGIGLEPIHVAFLSFAPSHLLPKTPSDLSEAMTFLDRQSSVFSLCGVHPGDFFSEFEGRWSALRRFEDDLLWMRLDDAFSEGAKVVARAVAVRREVAPDHFDVDDCDLVHLMARRLRLDVVRGNGLDGVTTRTAAWLRSIDLHETDPVPGDPTRDFDRLVITPLLSRRFGRGSSDAVARHLGFDPDAFVAAMDEDLPLDELEDLVSLPGAESVVEMENLTRHGQTSR